MVCINAILLVFVLLENYCLCLPTNWQGHLALLPHWNKIQTVETPQSSAPVPVPLTKPKTPFGCPSAPDHPSVNFPALPQISAWLHLLCIMTSISKSNQLLNLKILWRGFGVVFFLALTIKVSECTTCIIRLMGDNLNEVTESNTFIVQNHDLLQSLRQAS